MTSSMPAPPETPRDCPLCCNEMDATDRRFRPCRCGYQICAWCWHQLMELASKDDAKGRCPACRTEYDEDAISFDAVPEEELAANAQRAKKREGKAGAANANANANGTNGIKAGSGTGANAAQSQSRKHLQNVRVIQRNLVYVVGLSARCCKEEVLRKNDFFGKYGKILKLQVSVNRNGSSSYAGRNADDTGSAYVTFYEENDAMQCIQHIDGTPLDGRILRACFGTTKYCNAFLKYQPCNNPDCLYLHDIGRDNDSFTKEEMLAHYGTKHQSFQEATRVASESGGSTLERVSSLSSIPVPLPTGAARVPQPRVAPPAPPAGPPPPSAIGVGVPVASAWPSLGSSKAPPAPPPAPPPSATASAATASAAPKVASIPAPRVPAPRTGGVCPVRPMASAAGGWGQANQSLGVFGGPSVASQASASNPSGGASNSNSTTAAPKTKNGFALPQPRKVAGASSGVRGPSPKTASQSDGDAGSEAARPAGDGAAGDSFPDALFTDAFNSSLDFDPSAVLRKHTGASAAPTSPAEQPRASRFGFALEAQSPGQCPVAHGAGKNGESILRGILPPGANVRISSSTESLSGGEQALPAPRRGPPPGFGGSEA